MNRGMLMAIVAVAAVALLGVLMRRTGGSAAPESASGPPEPEPGMEDDPEDRPAEAVAVTSDGLSFMPLGDRDRVRLVPVPARREMEQVVPGTPAEQLTRGDLVAARVKRGAPDHDPWRVEGIGRDGEYRAWRFETEDAAAVALTLLASRIVRMPRDEDGNEVTMGERDYAEARRRDEEIEAELASMPDVEERPADLLRRTIE